MVDDSNSKDAAAGAEQVEAFAPLPGDLLREARKKKGWSPTKVAQELNLDADVVKAMENNSFEALGAPVFARGHLRKFARLVDLDPASVIEAYAAIEGIETQPVVLTAEGLTTATGRTGRGRWQAVVAIVVLVAALVVLISRLLVTGNEEQGQPEATQQAPLPAPSAEEATLVDVPQTAADTGADIGGEEQEVTATDADRTAVVESPTVHEDSVVRESPAAGTSTLGVRFSDDSWIEVRDADGKRLLYELGRGGLQRSVSGRLPFQVFVGFADGVRFEVDGRSVPIPAASRLGKTARFSIPVETGDR